MEELIVCYELVRGSIAHLLGLLGPETLPSACERRWASRIKTLQQLLVDLLLQVVDQVGSALVKEKQVDMCALSLYLWSLHQCQHGLLLCTRHEGASTALSAEGERWLLVCQRYLWAADAVSSASPARPQPSAWYTLPNCMMGVGETVSHPATPPLPLSCSVSSAGTQTSAAEGRVAFVTARSAHPLAHYSACEAVQPLLIQAGLCGERGGACVANAAEAEARRGAAGSQASPRSHKPSAVGAIRAAREERGEEGRHGSHIAQLRAVAGGLLRDVAARQQAALVKDSRTLLPLAVPAPVQPSPLLL